RVPEVLRGTGDCRRRARHPPRPHGFLSDWRRSAGRYGRAAAFFGRADRDRRHVEGRRARRGRPCSASGLGATSSGHRTGRRDRTDDVGEAAKRDGADAPYRNFGYRPAALRRHAYPQHERDRPGRGDQNREQGQAEPPHHARLRLKREEPLPYAHPEALVGTEWLAAYLGDPHVRVVDASFKLPGITPTAREDYDRGHIPGAVFFDIDDIAEPGTSLPHMIPSPQLFARKMEGLGIGDDDRVIVYDSGLSSAGRAWWMLR